MIKHIQKLGKRGDTIVEVLICLAVLGLTLGSATVVVNNNRKTIMGTQERSVALKLVQGQIEKTRALVAQDSHQLVSAGTTVRNPLGYCIDASGQAVLATTAPCTVDRSGVATAEVPNYQLKTVVTANAGGYLLRATANWDMPNGVRGNVEIVHRIYQ